MSQITSLRTTSDRIRALDAKGMSKSEIAKFLNRHFKEPGRPHDFRYQHVYNVLAAAKPTIHVSAPEMTTEATTRPILPERLDVHLDAAGRVVIPAVFRAAMEVGEGDRLMARLVDGELRLMTPNMAVRLAQKLVRETIPGEDSLAQSLIEDRRREFEREMADG